MLVAFSRFQAKPEKTHWKSQAQKRRKRQPRPKISKRQKRRREFPRLQSNRHAKKRFRVMRGAFHYHTTSSSPYLTFFMYIVI